MCLQVSTLLIGVSFAVVIEGQIPKDSSQTAVTLWSASVGLSFFFLLGSMLLLVQLQRLMGSWMRAKLRSHLNILRKVMREGVRLDSFLLHECGVPRPGSTGLSKELQKLWADIDSAADDRPTPRTEEELERQLAEHLVLLRWVLVEVHEPEQDFREYQKRTLKWARTASRGGLQLGTLMLLVNSAVQVQTFADLFYDEEGAGWVFVALVMLTAVVGYMLPRTMNYFLPNIQPVRPPLGGTSASTGRSIPSTSAGSMPTSARDGRRAEHSSAVPPHAQAEVRTVPMPSEDVGVLGGTWNWLTGLLAGGSGGAQAAGPDPTAGRHSMATFMRETSNAAPIDARAPSSRRLSLWAGPEDGVAPQPIPPAVNSSPVGQQQGGAADAFVPDPSRYSAGKWTKHVSGIANMHNTAPPSHLQAGGGGRETPATGTYPHDHRRASDATHTSGRDPQLVQAIRRALESEYGAPQALAEGRSSAHTGAPATGGAHLPAHADGDEAGGGVFTEEELHAAGEEVDGLPPRAPLPNGMSARSGLSAGSNGGGGLRVREPWHVPGGSQFDITPAYASSDH